MKKYLLLLSLVVILPGYAQVTTEPQFPMEKDSIIITFDATQAEWNNLVGYTGTVYAHTGVNTNKGNWQHVIAAWNVNLPKAALTRKAANIYELKIGYPRSYYNLTDTNETINQLAFVFRSADGTKQTEDIFVDIFKSGISVILNNPPVRVEYGDPLRSPGFVSPGDTLPIDITAIGIETVISSVELFVDNILTAQTSNGQLNFNFIASDYSEGVHSAYVVSADTGVLRDTTEFALFVNPEIINEPLPAGAVPGINFNNDNTVTFALFAPYKKFVYLIGSFNDWKVNTDYFLKKYEVSPDSVIWHITLDGMTPGTERLFQYFVDGIVRIADPYSEKILDPENDKYISSSTYPGLIPYPEGKTWYAVTAFETGLAPYQWEVTEFQKPKKTDLIIYELLIRDFIAQHDFKTLRDTLTYLSNLGITAIELMPVNEFEGNESWGYNPSFYFAPDKYYGPAEELKKLIDQAHKLGMAVIIDIVLNHSYGQSPLVRLYWDTQQQRPAENNPWYNIIGPNPSYRWGYDFNHESIHTKNFIDRVNRYWIEEYKVDGFRFDHTKGFTNRVPNPPDEGSVYDASRISILDRMAKNIFEIDSSVYVILEHFTDNSEETELVNKGMMIWGKMNYDYNEATMGYHSNLTGTYYKSRGWTKPHLVSYMESHDEERLMVKNILYGNSYGDYKIKDVRTALNRMKAAWAFFALIPGPQMIWQFGELGYDISIDYPCRICNKPIRWDYYNDPKRNNLYKVVSALNRIKTEYDVFETDNFTYSLADSVKRLKLVHPEMDVVVIGNFGVMNHSIAPYFTISGTWYDYFSGDSITVNDPTAPINLLPGEFHIYSRPRITPPDPGILSDIDDQNTGSASNLVYDLEQNYPNPFNPSTVIKYQVPERAYVTLRIYDIIGREIRTLVNKEIEGGTYEVEFNASGLSSGIYFYKLDSGMYSNTKKMILLK